MRLRETTWAQAEAWGDTYFEVAGLVDDAHAASADLLDATGYQENLITLEELRCRMPELRKQQRAIEGVLQSVEMTAVDPTP